VVADDCGGAVVGDHVWAEVWPEVEEALVFLDDLGAPSGAASVADEAAAVLDEVSSVGADA
jgi:hypothetical protein